jgi:hypothetical protein
VTITPGDKPASAKLSGGGTRAMLPACFSREIVPTSARWASVGTYSAGILRFQSLNQGTRARYTKNGATAYSRNPDKPRELADEVVKADLNLPETLKAAFEGAHGVFLVTNFGNKAPMSARRQPRLCGPPKMPASNISSGQRYLM